jgi:dTDP-L-rhamnose 4-epimerase
MKILVTGGAGFIGSYIVDKLVEEGHDVRSYDNLDPQVHPGSRKPPYLNKSAEFIKGDVRDREGLKKAIKGAEVIFHEAACVGVGQSQYEIKKYSDVNIGGTANLFDILAEKRHRVKKVLVAASMSSYGEGEYRCPDCGKVNFEKRDEKKLKKKYWEPFCPNCKKGLSPVPTSEEKKRNSFSIYALTKRVQEDMAAVFARAYNFPVTALRYFNAYGPRQSLSNPYTGVCAIFISRIKNKKSPVVYEDGKQARDFISVHDIVRANIFAMKAAGDGFKAYNVGSGRPVAIKELAVSLAGYMGRDIPPHITHKYRKGDIRHCYADITRIEKDLGFTPETDFTVGMKELLEWSKGIKARDKFSIMQKELLKKGLL